MVTPVKKKVKRRITKKTPAAEVKAKEKKPASPKVIAKEEALVASALAKIQIAHEMQMKLLREEVARITINSAQPPVEWIFDIVRNDIGLITQIKARVPETKKTLN